MVGNRCQQVKEDKMLNTTTFCKLHCRVRVVSCRCSFLVRFRHVDADTYQNQLRNYTNDYGQA